MFRKGEYATQFFLTTRHDNIRKNPMTQINDVFLPIYYPTPKCFARPTAFNTHLYTHPRNKEQPINNIFVG